MSGRDSRQAIDEVISSIEKKGCSKKLDEKDCKVLEEASTVFRQVVWNFFCILKCI